uniref:Axonemal dynein heavy chain 1 n=1 Tax=Halisarca dujardinii TaxID=2583056 RepID=A0A9F1U404_HALDU|nr:axonemal dynein heavy chain 1 [Halisarca dujardinii]
MSSRPGTRKDTSRGRRDLLKSRATATTRLGTGNRGFYSEIVTPGSKDRILDPLEGPNVSQNVIAKSKRTSHLPPVSQFTVPDSFDELLKSQIHGPTTQLISAKDFAKRSWNPKVQVAFDTQSGMTPRKLEIERRKRDYTQQNLSTLLVSQGVVLDCIIPPKQKKIPDSPQKKEAPPDQISSKQNKRPTLSFQPFLPLEIFDDTDCDCRTPEEWIALGLEEGGERKFVPAQAFLPSMASLLGEGNAEEVGGAVRPHPPQGDLPSDRRISSARRLLVSRSSSSTSLLTAVPDHEWTSVGVLDYNPSTKRFLVKRVNVPDKFFEKKKMTEDGEALKKSESEERKSGIEEGDGEETAVGAQDQPGSSPKQGSSSLLEGEEKRRDGSNTPSANTSSDKPITADSSEDNLGSTTGSDSSSPPSPNGNTDPKLRTNQKKKNLLSRKRFTPYDTEDHLEYWVPRIHLMFQAEDPRVFAQRLHRAYRMREATESCLRYNLYVDCMPVDTVADMSTEGIKKISQLAKSLTKLKSDSLSEVSSKLVKEINLDFQRSQNRMLFDRTVARQPQTFHYVAVPQETPQVVPAKGMCQDVPKFAYQDTRNQFQFLTLFTSKPAIEVVVHTRSECSKVTGLNLFHTSGGKPLKIDDFKTMQEQANNQVQTYLDCTWIPQLKHLIQSGLMDVDKGWFNIHEDSWDVYLCSKLKRLMELVRYAMQDALRALIEKSLQAFLAMVQDACVVCLGVPRDYLWEGDLVHSPFVPINGPLFALDLLIDSSGVHFSADLGDFELMLVQVFDRGIQVTQKIPRLERMIMDRLFWPQFPELLESVGDQEGHVCQMRARVAEFIRHALVPLKAYAVQFRPFIPLANTSASAFIEEFTAEDKTTSQVRTEIDKYLKQKNHIEATFPPIVIIGPFYVLVETLRVQLSKKCKELSNSLLEYMVKRLKVETDEICAEFRDISRKLFDRPNAIEDLTEQRDYMKTIPEFVSNTQERINQAMINFDLVEDYCYPLSNEGFDARWTTLGWPHKIQEQIDNCDDQLSQDEERFQKNLANDQSAFEDRLDTLQMVVAGFSGHTDLSKAQEIRNDVRRVTNNMKECQQLAQKYNQRERLFGLPVTQYDKASKLAKDFEPYKNLWNTAADWGRYHETWMNDSLVNIDPDIMATNVNGAYKTIHKCSKFFKDIPALRDVSQEVKDKIEEFKPHIPLIQGLRNPGMRNRHWEQLSSDLGMNIRPKQSLTFAKCLEIGLQNHTDEIATVGEIAGKEYAIEQALEKMEAEWDPIDLEIIAYKETGTFIMRTGEETSQQLDDHIVMTQAMSFSPYKKPFEMRIATWENKLRVTQDVMEEWATCQRSWLYLEPIFSSDDINRQLPVEGKRYQTMERIWRKIMNSATQNSKMIALCSDAKLLDNLKECNKLLEQVQKGLSDYLETKRSAFPRFYFLSDDELLEILSQTKDPTAVQPHLRKCFENIAKLKFEEDLRISQMFSGDGEMVPFHEELYPKGNVEDWLLQVEVVMKSSLRKILGDSLENYTQVPRTTWVLGWPGQIVIAGCQVFWTKEVTEALHKNEVTALSVHLISQLGDLVSLVRGKLKKMERAIMSALIVIEVHARDVVLKMVEEDVKNVNDFEWIGQLRYYWENELLIRAVNAEFVYGYEYLGNTGRLVITPLTDRCYLTLTGALHLKFGGAPAGPAGTGKTETVKDLAKAMAVQCVVFNCSDQLDFMAMGKFFKGLASSGAWACFDEFNRIDIEVLSVVAQQITTIQQAQQQRLERFMFEGVEIMLKCSCSVFITMNPGYAGRTELPDNLKALFRPVAMMVPNYAMIAEISLYSFGFSSAKVLSKKIVTTFKLSSEQLSSQYHYDFGMRAVKTVISAAGNLKRENPEMNEELIVLRAVRDVNVPKFLQDDLKLFRGIVSDLFPRIKEEPVDYGELKVSISKQIKEMGLDDTEDFVNKCIQLYETTVVRHGLMLVGPTMSGKTMCYNVLKNALSSLKGSMAPSDSVYELIHTYVLNPKSITMGQLYGEFDAMTHEWTDGILSSLVRGGNAADNSDKRWYLFDGPVDAIWIENMNTVLDDNKKLCLTSGEIIKLSESMTMMFEVQDLAVASPATVSRCGMVYLEPRIIGLQPFVQCWLRTIPEEVAKFTDKLQTLFDLFLVPCIDFVRKNCKEIVPTVNGNLTFSVTRILDCFFKHFVPKEGEAIPKEKLQALPQIIEPWFIFAIIWSVGATCYATGKVKFNIFIREKLKECNVALAIPDEGLVYDYQIQDGGLFSTLDKKGGDDEEEEKSKGQVKICWIGWMEKLGEYTVDPMAPFSDIIVPTLDNVRSSYLIGLLLESSKQVLCVGPTGTGKTLTSANKLIKYMPDKYMSDFITFSARTSANQTQDIIDSKLDKRRKGVFGPPLGKKYIFFVDDLNMPAVEVYGAQPPIELLRQWLDHRGWYDRKAIGQFRNLVDINFMCAMGPPGGGRNPITPRFTRHFNHLSFTELEDTSKFRIFAAILGSWLGRSTLSGAKDLTGQIVNATISVYNTIATELLPTPAKSHYTFNLRDLSKVFQGILMVDSSSVKELSSVLRLWYHELCRVFEDRLVSREDRDWFQKMVISKLDAFGVTESEVVNQDPVLYGDFMNPSADVKKYEEIADHQKMKRTADEFLEDYNQVTTAQMKLELFMDALKHVTRISRIVRQPLGNALLLGVGGSGRQSLTRLSSHMADYDCFQIELAKNYGVAEWREDVKTVLLKAGLDDKQIVFLFSDTQIKSEVFLEDINNVLNSGDVPNIYALEDLDRIYHNMKPAVLDAGLQPTKSNLFSTYTKRVRSNIHMVICMSPLGEIFRSRLRQFPSLVTCCTIDWFSEWPDEALRSVARTFLGELPELDSPEVIEGLVGMCVEIHQLVDRKSTQYKAELSRHNYVTPTSYLELLSLFSKLLKLKKAEVSSARSRNKTGLDKLLATGEQVAVLQAELEIMHPELEKAQVETEETMEQIQKDTIVANDTKEIVSKEEKEAKKKAEESLAIQQDAERDLAEALPALDAALASLKSLNKNDVVEVRALQHPPLGVKLVIDAVCIMKEIKPRKVAGEKLGTKVDDYWDNGKIMLQDPPKFLKSLFDYDKDNIQDAVIQKIQPYIDNEEFMPEAIARVSKACTSLCQWVRAMHKYHFVSKGVAPKRAALEGANRSLEETKKTLAKAKAGLQEIADRISGLQKKYEECVAKKQDLAERCDVCSARLERAEKLIGGLADEKIRWGEAVTVFDQELINVVGDVLISAGSVAYLGPFTGKYRNSMVTMIQDKMTERGVPHTKGASLVSILSDPVKIRSWQIAGLPKDALSVENGVIVYFSRKWPLFIDPQGQANKWVKNLEKEKGLDVLKLTDKDFLRSLENAVRFGKPCLLENVKEELDPALEPILLKQTFKQAGSLVIKLGDSVIPYHDDFKFYITTKMPNPHYTPEISTKVTLMNFTLSPGGLEDQLLGIVVAEERPDLEEAKNQLIVSNAKMKQELKQIEDEILFRLSNSEGNPVDDIELIRALEASKVKSQEIEAKVQIADKTEKDIDVTRSKYIPVAVRTQILFFCTTDLANIDPMYQYSLEWFISIFLGSIHNAEASENLDGRIFNINEYFTFSLYSNVCRSLFEKHKLLFSFLLCVRILMNDNKIDMNEWRYLISGGTVASKKLPNPASDWLSDRSWSEVLTLAALSKFTTFAEEFSQHVEGFKVIFDSTDPHREALPGHWDAELNSFQKLLSLKCIRPDKITNAMQDYVSQQLGQKFIEPQTADLSIAFKDSGPKSALIFILSAGTDPADDLYKFAEKMKFSKKLTSISLGQGQGPIAESMMKEAIDRGRWVFFQNCHLAPSWMPSLERLIEQINPDTVHRDFRLWLTSMPSPKFPVPILQNGSKLTLEPPRGVKANLLKSFTGFTDDFLTGNSKGKDFKYLLLSLCIFHGITLERRKFGALGFNIPYGFTDGDLRICISQLNMFLDEYEEIPFKVLKYTAGHINYGGRVTDDWDRRCIMNILDGYYNPKVMDVEYKFSESGTYHQIDPLEANHKKYMDYIKSLPINDNPELFGLHDNANITFAQNETFALLTGLLQLQPKQSSGGGVSREEVVEKTAKGILEKVPKPIPLDPVAEKFPVKYEESMNTVLVQEVIRYSRLLTVIHQSSSDLLKALKGLVVMSQSLETMADSLYNNTVPELWADKAYPSLKPLASWVLDLIDRMSFIQKWISDGIPSAFWISGFFFPQAFLTGTLQNFARKEVISIDTITFSFTVVTDPHQKLTQRPENGCYIYGLFVEGARWDMTNFVLSESRPKELYTDMPVMWLVPTANRIQPSDGIYMCPVYKTLTRAGTLSTTGHSTNYVIAVEVPSRKDQMHWIKRGVALLCALDY